MVDKIRFPWFKSGRTYKEGLDACQKWADEIAHTINGIPIKEIIDNKPPAVSPHWPGVGRYVGIVCIDKPFKDRQLWQTKRVYQDELDYLNGEMSAQNYNRIYKEIK